MWNIIRVIIRISLEGNKLLNKIKSIGYNYFHLVAE